jgi:hypothetical protein
MHTNEPYYERHIGANPLPGGEIFLHLEFFDASEDIEPHTLAFLHFVVVLVDSLDAMLSGVLPETGMHTPLTPKLEAELAGRAARFGILPVLTS